MTGCGGVGHVCCIFECDVRIYVVQVHQRELLSELPPPYFQVCVDTESASSYTSGQWQGGVKVLTLCRKTVAAYLGPLPNVKYKQKCLPVSLNKATPSHYLLSCTGCFGCCCCLLEAAAASHFKNLGTEVLAWGLGVAATA